MGNKHSSLIDMLDRLEEFCREQGLEMDTFAYAMEQMKYNGREILYLEDGGKVIIER